MNTYQHLISGGVSGFASAVVLQPFDLVKTRLQQDNKFHIRNSIASNSGTRVVLDSLASNTVPTTKGSTKGAKGPSIPRVFMKIWREEGRLALWRGTGATLARNVPGVALYYTSLQHVRNTFATLFSSAVVTTRPGAEKGRVSTLTVLSPTGNLAAGALTRTAIGFVLNPLTIVKARFESNYYSYRGITQAVISLSREGAGGSGSLAYRKLFQGFTATALRDAPYAGIFLVVYEGVKQKLGGMLGPDSGNPWGPTLIHTSSGAAGGTIATVLTHPFDAIKTKMQVRREERYKSLGSTVKAILQERGALGLLDGVSLRLSRKVLSSMLTWTIYEGALLFFKRL